RNSVTCCERVPDIHPQEGKVARYDSSALTLSQRQYAIRLPQSHLAKDLGSTARFVLHQKVWTFVTAFSATLSRTAMFAVLAGNRGGTKRTARFAFSKSLPGGPSTMINTYLRSWVFTILLVGFVALAVSAQNFRAHDPGPRPNPQSHIPSPVPGL